MNNVGLGTLVSELEALVASCKVSELAFDGNWTGPSGQLVSKTIVHDKLIALGVNDYAQRQDLVRQVWAS